MCECDVVRWSQIVVSLCAICAIGKTLQLAAQLAGGDEVVTSTYVLDMISFVCAVLYTVLVPLFITRCGASEHPANQPAGRVA